MSYIETMIKDISGDFRFYITSALIFALLVMFLKITARDLKFKDIVKVFLINLKEDKKFKYQFFFWLYTYFIFDKTLLRRDYIFEDPLLNVMGDWRIIPINGQIDIKGVENLLFFIPYMFLFMKSFCKSETKDSEVIFKSIYVSFMTSFSIEMCQFIFRVGTLQISDLVYNTLGGFIGALIFLMLRKIKH